MDALGVAGEGFLAVIFGFSVYFLATTFASYWHHRLMHWRWFWNLHRYHHSTPELNIFSGNRGTRGWRCS